MEAILLLKARPTIGTRVTTTSCKEFSARWTSKHEWTVTAVAWTNISAVPSIGTRVGVAVISVNLTVFAFKAVGALARGLGSIAIVVYAGPSILARRPVKKCSNNYRNKRKA